MRTDVAHFAYGIDCIRTFMRNASRSSVFIDLCSQFLYFINQSSFSDAAEIADHALQTSSGKCRASLQTDFSYSTGLRVVVHECLGNEIRLRFCCAFRYQCPRLKDVTRRKAAMFIVGSGMKMHVEGHLPTIGVLASDRHHSKAHSAKMAGWDW